ncbi:MAG: hypothetical protein ISN26_03635 [Betaproteobacteria bacterium AqS2]|uniref:Uncharacterized protein n=1 Tax=Candidatus Amphirhobacter heronislandensis TaxID=1732024 RepID=A0A930UC20_9GAMM|nr:hypothetical protein [Betaproteobacteria bacterium AqS2]
MLALRIIILDCYRQRVAAGSAIEAVSLDEEDGRESFVLQLWADFGRMHRCDYYKVVETEEGKSLVLIEKTDFAKSVDLALDRFKEALKNLAPGLAKEDRRGLIAKINESRRARKIWNLIFRELCEEHVAKAQATLLILERMYQVGVDRELASIFKYANIHYIMLVPDDSSKEGDHENPEDRSFQAKIAGLISNRMAASFVSPKRFSWVREKEFDRRFQETMMKS